VPEIRADPFCRICRKNGRTLPFNIRSPQPVWPQLSQKWQRLQAQMKEVDDQIARESKGIVLQLESDYREAKQREGLIRQALELQKAETNNMAEKWSSTTF